MREAFAVRPRSALLLALPLLLVVAAVAPAAAEAEEEPGRSLTVVPFPFLFYQDETELGGGASLSLVTRRQVEGARAENSGVLFIYTARQQYAVTAEVERFFDDERWHVLGRLGFEEFPSDFFGFGNDTDPEGSEVFTPRGFVAELSVENQFSGRWRTGPRLRVRTREIVETVEGGTLESLRPNGADGADVVALGWGLVHDGRDQVFYPRNGWWMRVGSDVALTSLGSDDAFTAHLLDLRVYRGLGDGPFTAAARVVAQHTAGDAPFDVLPVLGGAQLLRGYFGGRFLDRTLYALQTELRVGHWKRLGAVTFAEFGRVANGLDALSFDDLHASFGVGLRLQLSPEEKLHVRADLGFTEDGGGFYLAFLEAF